MSLCARGKGASRRCSGAARHSSRLVASCRFSRRTESGFGLVEIIVSLAVFAIISLPMTRIIVTTESASDSLHLRAEAADLATQALETAQYKTQNGVNPTAGVTTSTQFSGADKFTVAVDFVLAPGTGSSNTVCVAPPGSLNSQIWQVTATASWGVGGQKGSVVESTLVSPSEVDLADTNAGEIAIPVFTAAENINQLETASSVSMTATGTCTISGGCGTVPSNEVTSETVNTGTTGCAVFTSLFAGAGETYTISVTPPSGYVDPNEYFWNSTITAYNFYTGIAPPPNEVDLVDNPYLVLAQAAPITVGFQVQCFGGGNSCGSASPDIPISVKSPGVLNCIGAVCVLGNGSTSIASSGAAIQLFPGTAVTDVSVASVTTSSTSASVTVTSGGFPGVLAGWGISGNNVANGTTVVSVSGNTLTMSANATASGSTTLTFLPPNTYAWAGDAPVSEPDNGDYGSLQPTAFQALSGNAVTLTLPLYPLELTVKWASGVNVSAMQVADSNGGDTMNLNSVSSTPSSGSSWNTGLPLGQYQLEATNTGTQGVNYGSSGTTSPVYVWVTPTGVCVQAGSTMTTCTSSSSSFTTSPITVTVG